MRLTIVLLVALATTCFFAEARLLLKDGPSKTATKTDGFTYGIGEASAWGGAESNDAHVSAAEKTTAKTKIGFSGSSSESGAKSDKDKAVYTKGISSAEEFSEAKTGGGGFASDKKSAGFSETGAVSGKGKADALSKTYVEGPTGEGKTKSNSEAKGFASYTEGKSAIETDKHKTTSGSGSASKSILYGSAKTATSGEAEGVAGDASSDAFTSTKKNADAHANSGSKATKKTAEGGTYTEASSTKPGWSKAAAAQDAESGNEEASVKSSGFSSTDNLAKASTGSKTFADDKKEKVSAEGAAVTKSHGGVAKATTDAKAKDKSKKGKDNEASAWTGGYSAHKAEGYSSTEADVKHDTAKTEGHTYVKSEGGVASHGTKAKSVSNN